MSSEFIDETGGAERRHGAATQVDSIWLTRTSVKPVWLAVSIMLALIGLFAFWPLLAGATVAAAAIAISWIAEARAESDELPLG